MRVLHVAKWDSAGGASTAMLRLHNELLNKGVDSIVLCERSSGNVKNVKLVSKGWRFQLGRTFERLVGWFTNLQKDGSLFFNSINVRPNSLLKRINELKPDVVHLHWVGLGVLRIEDLPKIKQPLVWTLHDMWAFCGSEHCNLDGSDRWKKSYSKGSRCDKASGPDLTRWVWQRKYKAWSSVALTTIAPSSWMQACATSSSLWKDNTSINHKCIYNGLDTDLFKPIEKLRVRSELKLEGDLPVLLFGAQSLNSKVKGGDLLKEALRMAKSRGLKFQLMTFGSGGDIQIPDVKITNLGYVRNPDQLAKVYNAADVMLVPSRIESFGQVASEALACGTPVLCFDTSGLKEVVEHKVCGYCAECFSIEDLVDGLEWLLQIADKAALHEAARGHVLKNFQISKIANTHIELYSTIMGQ